MRPLDIYCFHIVLNGLEEVSKSNHANATEARLVRQRWFHYHNIDRSLPDCILGLSHGVLKTLWYTTITPYIVDSEVNGVVVRSYDVPDMATRIKLNSIRCALLHLESAMKESHDNSNGKGWIFFADSHKHLPRWENPHKSNEYQYEK